MPAAVRVGIPLGLILLSRFPPPARRPLIRQRRPGNLRSFRIILAGAGQRPHLSCRLPRRRPRHSRLSRPV